MIFKVISILLILIVVVNAGKYKKPKPTTTTAPPPPPPPTYPSYPWYPSYPTPAPTTAAPTAAPTTAAAPPMPYKFAYVGKVGSPYPTGQISRQESSNGGVVTGSVSFEKFFSKYLFSSHQFFLQYSLLDTDGRQRTVIYRADNTGFHATVKTNELPYVLFESNLYFFLIVINFYKL
jgi:hypothetical protein